MNDLQEPVSQPVRITWEDIKNFVNKMDDSLLSRNANVLIDDNNMGIPIREITVIDSDIYVHRDDIEDCGILDELKELYGDAFNELEYELMTPKGFPFFLIDNYL